MARPVLRWRSGETTMKTLLATLLLAATAASAAAGPDFVSRNPRPHPLAASSGTSEVGPADDLLFDLGSHTLSPQALERLTAAAAWAKLHPGYRLVLEGYTDGSGSRVFNEDLATTRAVAARNYLMVRGVPADRIVIVVFGEATATARIDSLSRRVVFYATDRAPREIAIASMQHKRALSAVWVDRNVLFNERRAPERTLVGSR
jgi:outer membrane protein OmpA-like peptidoglycan-associated protein